MRHHAVRAAAIRHDVAPFRQRSQAFPKFCDRCGDGTRNVSRHVLLARTDVDERDLTGADTSHELVITDRLQRATFLQVLARHLLDFCQP